MASVDPAQRARRRGRRLRRQLRRHDGRTHHRGRPRPRRQRRPRQRVPHAQPARHPHGRQGLGHGGAARVAISGDGNRSPSPTTASGWWLRDDLRGGRPRSTAPPRRVAASNLRRRISRRIRRTEARLLDDRTAAWRRTTPTPSTTSTSTPRRDERVQLRPPPRRRRHRRRLRPRRRHGVHAVRPGAPGHRRRALAGVHLRRRRSDDRDVAARRGDRHGETYHTSSTPPCGLPERALRVMRDRQPGARRRIPVPGLLGQTGDRARCAGGVTTNASAGDGRRARRPLRGRPGDRRVGRPRRLRSRASNLVPGPTLDEQHVYLRDLATGTTQRIDRTADGSAAADDAYDPAVSGDGTKVVFVSDSPDLPGAPTRTTRARVPRRRGHRRHRARRPDRRRHGRRRLRHDVDISADGSRVAFISDAMNLGGFATSQRSRLRQGRRVGRADLRLGAGRRHVRPVRAAAHAQRRRQPRGVGRDSRRLRLRIGRACPHVRPRPRKPDDDARLVGGPTGPGGCEVQGGSRRQRHAPGVPAGVQRWRPRTRAPAATSRPARRRISCPRRPDLGVRRERQP